MAEDKKEERKVGKVQKLKQFFEDKANTLKQSRAEKPKQEEANGSYKCVFLEGKGPPSRSACGCRVAAAAASCPRARRWPCPGSADFRPRLARPPASR